VGGINTENFQEKYWQAEIRSLQSRLTSKPPQRRTDSDLDNAVRFLILERCYPPTPQMGPVTRDFTHDWEVTVDESLFPALVDSLEITSHWWV
jgi:hypothetical protein